MKKILSVLFVAMLATASVNAAGVNHDKDCKKECCAKCDEKSKEACKGDKCGKCEKCTKAEAAKKCDTKKSCCAKPAQS